MLVVGGGAVCGGYWGDSHSHTALLVYSEIAAEWPFLALVGLQHISILELCLWRRAATMLSFGLPVRSETFL